MHELWPSGIDARYIALTAQLKDGNDDRTTPPSSPARERAAAPSGATTVRRKNKPPFITPERDERRPSRTDICPLCCARRSNAALLDGLLMGLLEVFLKNYAALIFAALAVWASRRANSYARQALGQAESVKLLELQSEALREIDRQNAKLGSLLTTLAETALVYSEDDGLRVNDSEGYSRIRNNIASAKQLRARYEEQRRLAEQNLGSGSLERQTRILAEIRRLTLHVEEDIEKEKRNLDRLQKRARYVQ